MKMKYFVLLVCLCAGWAKAQGQVKLSAEASTLFTAEIDSKDFQIIRIKNLQNEKESTVKYNHSISDLSTQLRIQWKNKQGKLRKVEAFLVTTASGAKTMDIFIQVPVPPEELLKVKDFKNSCALRQSYGDFSWNSSAELAARLRVVESHNRSVLQVKVGLPGGRNGSARLVWKDCLLLL